jgi:hypothetical protein
VLAVFSLVFGAGWAAAFPWLGRFALPAALPLAVLGVARFADDPRRLRVLGWISVAGSIAVLPAFGPASPNPAGCAVGLESRAGFGRRAWGNWWEACEEVNRMVPAGTRAVAVGEWRGRPASRLMARWIADEPVIRELVRGADSVRRLRIRLRQRRVGWLLHNLPQAGFWAGYAARYPWTPDSVARWRTFWDSSATLVWHSPVQDPVHGFFLLYRLSRAPGEAPARGWLPGTEGEFSELRRIVAATAFDPAADRELDRLTVLFGPRADVLARRGDLLAVRGRPVEGLAVCRAAERAAPESREVWSALGALPVAVPADLDRMVRAWRDVVDMGFTLGIPVALSARPIPNPVY